IVGMGLLIYVSLTLGEPLIKRLGKTGMGALNRVLGFLILAIAVQFVADGSIALLKSVPGLLN
ncbi:MAG: MarC family protein, partial [Gemmatimonadaceae bacterium]|nr:MarC family protein [Gloeobacterales cyanobacterium ES-bin-141]